MQFISLRRLKKSKQEEIIFKINFLKIIIITYLQKYVMNSKNNIVQVYTTKEALDKCLQAL
jgi:hypothetical protein